MACLSTKLTRTDASNQTSTCFCRFCVSSIYSPSSPIHTSSQSSKSEEASRRSSAVGGRRPSFADSGSIALPSGDEGRYCLVLGGYRRRPGCAKLGKYSSKEMKETHASLPRRMVISILISTFPSLSRGIDDLLLFFFFLLLLLFIIHSRSSATLMLVG